MNKKDGMGGERKEKKGLESLPNLLLWMSRLGIQQLCTPQPAAACEWHNDVEGSHTDGFQGPFLERKTKGPIRKALIKLYKPPPGLMDT